MIQHRTAIHLLLLLGMGCSMPACQPQEADPAATQHPAVGSGEAVRAASGVIGKAEAQAVDPQGQDPLDDPITCLARAIYWEARGAGADEMAGVANVVMNRLGHDGFPDTVCKVVRQGRKRGVCQFSWWCDGQSDSALEEQAYATAKEIARRALNHQLPDRTDGAMYFHHHDISPSWSTQYNKTVEIGPFMFYKPPGDAAK